MGAAQGILQYYGKEDLAGLVNRQWAYPLLKRMKFVLRKATTSISKYTVANFRMFFAVSSRNSYNGTPSSYELGSNRVIPSSS